MRILRALTSLLLLAALVAGVRAMPGEPASQFGGFQPSSPQMREPTGDPVAAVQAAASGPAASGTSQPQAHEPGANGSGGLDASWLDRPLSEARHAWNSRLERAYLTGLLHTTRGKVGETAARAGIDPRSLYSKMKQFGLRKEDFRQ